MSGRHLQILAALALVPWSGSAPAAAEPAPPFAELLAQADRTPIRAQALAEIEAARGRRTQAGAWRNPELDVTVENFGGRDQYSGIGRAETTVSLGQTLELGGKRQARVATASADVATAEAKGELSRAEFAARLAVAYAEAEAAQKRVALAEEALEAAQTDARSTKLMVEVGREAPLRALQAAAEADRFRAELSEARAKATEAFARLTALAGAERPYDRVAASILSLPPKMDGAVSAPRPAAVTAARAEQAAAAARVRAARAEAMPDVRLSAGLRRFEDEDTTALVAGFSLPLPLFNRNQGAVAAARADLSGAQARLRQAEIDAEADRRAALAQGVSASARIEAAASAEQAAAEAYRLARIGYEAGRVPLLELTAARRALAEARTRTLEAQLARVRAEANLARLTGRTPFETQ